MSNYYNISLHVLSTRGVILRRITILLAYVRLYARRKAYNGVESLLFEVCASFAQFADMSRRGAKRV